MPLEEFKGKIEKRLNEFGQTSAEKIGDALSKIYKEGIKVKMLQTDIIPTTLLFKEMGDYDLPIVATYSRLYGLLESSVLVISPEKDAFELVSMLKDQDYTGESMYMARSALKEIHNIISSICLNTLANILNISLVPSAYLFIVDTLGLILDFKFAGTDKSIEYTLMIGLEIGEENNYTLCYFFMVLDKETLGVILDAFQDEAP
jgi:chemotaxis protein CheY-P-specific phosphatase CheC